MKVSELIDAKLDYWTGRANAVEHLRLIATGCVYRKSKEGWVYVYSPSTDWSQGGSIIQDNDIVVQRDGYVWVAKKMSPSMSFPAFYHSGKSYLIAAMRCYVASKFGETVDDSQAD
jgi:hypothetical protein